MKNPKHNHSVDPEMTLPPSSETRLAQGVKTIQGVVKTLTLQPGVYRMINAVGDVLYVGKAKSLKKRVVAYTKVETLPNRLKRMVSETASMEIVTTHTETEALLLESNLIKKLQPRYNILLKDDKSFPYILLTKDHTFPRVLKHRGPHTLPGDYFGPFANVAAVDEAILVVQKIFQIRNCTNSYFEARKRPCLQYDIKRCSAPCMQKISEDAYGESLHLAKSFLKGTTDYVQKVLSEKMQKYSDMMNYEKAKDIRDTLRLMANIQARQRINLNGLTDVDVIGVVKTSGFACIQIFFYRYGRNFGTESFFLKHSEEDSEADLLSAFMNQFYTERQPAPLVLISHPLQDMDLLIKALKHQYGLSIQVEVPKMGMKVDLVQSALKNANDAIQRKVLHKDTLENFFDRIKELLNIQGSINRIEVYDNSHLQGSHACGVMIVATPEGFDKKAYRKFTPKQAQSNDDFAMMREFMERRLKHLEDWGVPDLLLIDGGLGQLSSVHEILDRLGLKIPTVAIAKGKDRNAGKERLFIQHKEPISLAVDDPLLHFLQIIRDEAHRFAIGTHRHKQNKGLTQSKLDDIPGIGPQRKKILLHHFGSAKNVSRAGIADLERVEGINRAIAEKIYYFFHQ